MVRGGLKVTDNIVPFFLNFNPFLLKARQKPLITTGTTTGLVSLMICAVPFLTGAKGLVVPCGKVITQLLSSVRMIFRVSVVSRPLRTSEPSERQVRFTVNAPARVNKRLIQEARIVSSAA